jgi:hypothetical protein
MSEREGVDAEPEMSAHRKGIVDPTGHVSSGLQTGPLRGVDEAPVASVDEATREPSEPAGADADITEAYAAREDEE